MSNPTTPFSWQMPTATDLVTDLPADFEVFGQAVATSMADLLGGTTGQVLSKTSNTDMDFTWTSPNPGDITGVTAGTGISGGGTSGDVTVTNSMATALTTKGDLTPATGSAAFARLGVGANDTVLTADSTAATGLKWATPSAGGMTLLSTTTLTGATTTISSISASYTNLVYYIVNYIPATSGTALYVRFNSDTGSNYRNVDWAPASGAVMNTAGVTAAGAWNNLTGGLVYGELPYYSNTSSYKYHRASGTSVEVASQPALNAYHGFYNSTSAISSMTFRSSSGNMTSGTVYLYGVK